jgi:hypothetical protein
MLTHAARALGGGRRSLVNRRMVGPRYLATVIGMLLAGSGLNHGVEIQPALVEFSRARCVKPLTLFTSHLFSPL